MPAEYGNDNDNGDSYEDIDSTDFKELSNFIFLKWGPRDEGWGLRKNNSPNIVTHSNG